MKRFWFFFPLFVLVLGLAGCFMGPMQMPSSPPPSVTVSTPIVQEVTDYADFTGRTAPVECVNVRARVWGHLQKINYVEGAEVKKGDVLYIIDQAPYKAALKRAEADVAQSEARVKRLEADFGRAQTTMARGAIAREEFDKILGDMDEARAGAAVPLPSRKRLTSTSNTPRYGRPSMGRSAGRS